MTATNTTKWKIDPNTVALIFSIHQWGNSRKASLPTLVKARGGSMVDDKAAKRLKLSKQLIVSSEYDKIHNYLLSVKGWIVNRSMPSFFREGCYLFRADMVESVDSYLRECKGTLAGLIGELLQAYPNRIQEAKAILEPDGLFNLSEYPMPDDMREAFYWDYQWVAFTVPEGLPEGIREQAIAKMQNMWEDAATSITSALRESFQKLVSHAVEKLSPSSDGKKKVIRDTFIPNIMEFLETFNSRNITNDRELQVLVDRAKAVLSGVDGTKDLKDNEVVQKVVRREFEKITRVLDGMTIERPRRAFSLRDEE